MNDRNLVIGMVILLAIPVLTEGFNRLAEISNHASPDPLPAGSLPPVISIEASPLDKLRYSSARFALGRALHYP